MLTFVAIVAYDFRRHLCWWRQHIRSDGLVGPVWWCFAAFC